MAKSYLVTCIHPVTGKVVTVTIEADSPEAARAEAESVGFQKAVVHARHRPSPKIRRPPHPFKL